MYLSNKSFNFFIKYGLPDQPKSLTLTNVNWAHIPAYESCNISVEEDGTLRLEAEIPLQVNPISDPNLWNPSHFVAEVDGHGPLFIEQGADKIIRGTYGSNRATRIAAIEGWKWSAISNIDHDFWCAPIKFSGEKPPIVLWWKNGNMVLAVDGHLVRGWRFETGYGQVFLVPHAECWYLAYKGIHTPPTANMVHLVRSILGFVFGEPLSVGLFQAIDEQGLCSGLLHLGLLRYRESSSGSEPPPLFLLCEPSWIADFVDKLFLLSQKFPSAPILEVTHLYFASLIGFIESSFLHVWVGLEKLAHWGIHSGLIANGGKMRIANHDDWFTWVMDHQEEIKDLAIPGFEQSLVDRVRSSEFNSPTMVQRAFRGLDLPWTNEMEEVEQIRHGVVHEGSMTKGVRDWDRNIASICFRST